MSYPSNGTCSIRPLWANSRCVPGGRGWTSGRGVGPTGGGTPPWSIPTGDKHWKISGLVVVGKPTSNQFSNFFNFWSFNTQKETLWSLVCPALNTCDLLTHWSAARPRASPGDLLSIAVHAPAVSRAAVALHGLIGTVLVACRDVLSNGRSGAPWAVLRHTQETVSVGLTLCFCPL